MGGPTRLQSSLLSLRRGTREGSALERDRSAGVTEPSRETTRETTGDESDEWVH